MKALESDRDGASSQEKVLSDVPPCTREFWTARRLAVVFTVVVSVIVDLFFFSGFFGSDDISYFGGAVNLLRDGKLNVTFSNGRLTLVGWNLLVILFAGWNGQLVAATYIVFHQILNLSTYGLARRLYGDRVAMLSLFGTATMPLLIIYSTCILPDLPLACCFVLALHAFLRGLDARISDKPKRAHRWLLLAGIAVGFGYMAKETALILLPFFFVLWISQEWRSRKSAAIVRGAMFAAGFFGVMALETATLSWMNHGFHFRMGWTVNEMDESTRAHISRFGSEPMGRLQWVDGRLDDRYMVQSIKPVIIACFVVYPFLYRRRWAVYALGLWAFAYLTWGSMRLTEYFPPSISPRYFIPVVPFAMIVTAAVLVRAYDVLLSVAARVRAASMVRVAAFIVLGLYAVLGLRGPNDVAGKVYGADDITNTAMAIRQAMYMDDRPIVLGPISSRRTYRLLQRGQMPGVKVWGELAYEGGFRQLAQQGGWHFILVDPDRSDKPSTYDFMEWPMAWIVRDIPQDESADSAFPWMRAVRSLDPLVGDYVEFSGYRLRVNRVERIRQPYTRTARFAAEHLSMLNDWRTQTDGMLSARGVLLLDVVAQRLEDVGPAWDAAAFMELVGPSRRMRNLTTALGRGKATRNADSLRVRRNSTGGPRITFKLPQRDFSLFEPSGASDPGLWKIPARTQCDINLMYESVSLSKNAHVGFELEFYADPDWQTPITTQHIELRQGLNLLGVRTGDQTVYMKPVIRMEGRGRFTIENLSMHLR